MFAVTSQQKPDGSIGSFSIPVGSVFVITSWEWQTSGGVSSVATTWSSLFAVEISNGAAWVSNGNGTSDASGNAAGTTLVPSGVAIKSGATLCFRMFNNNTPGAVLVHGFMAKDK
jgi:hypothetical protein